MDGEHFAWFSIGVYGNGSDGYGDVTVTHNDAMDECSCDDCVAFAADEG